MTIPQAFELALQHHQAARLAEAEALYRQILEAEPRHAEALHFLGIIAHQVGKNDVAVELIRQAAALQPGYPEVHNNLGNALKDNGQWDEAMAAYRQALALKPDYPEARCNLGNTLKDKGLLDEAMAAYRQALALKPNLPEAHYNLGLALKDKGQLDEAMAACRQALTLKPNYPEACNNLGLVLKDKGQLDEAMAAYRQALALKPGYAEACCNLGNALKGKGQWNEAVAAYRQALALKPNLPEVHYNLGLALKDRGQLDEAIGAYRQALAIKPDYLEAQNNLGLAIKDKGQLVEAIAAFRQAIALNPDYPEAHCNLGNALKDAGQLDEAMAAFRRALTLQPNLPEAHYNLGVALLVQGDFHAGWPEYEWRWKLKHADFPERSFAQPQWDGGPLEGRTLLLRAEQGIGDAIQFIRYVPLVRQRDRNIIIDCEPELKRLFQRMAPDLPVVAKGEPLPAIGVHCPLLSLPGIFSTDLSNIPRTVPYLHADAAEAAIWRDRLTGDARSFKVGLVWAGSAVHTNDRNRSVRLACLAPLAKVPGVQFYSLQKGDAGAEAKDPPEGMELVDVAGELKDFADTAALIANLDLVISVDTAVVHLAGAMGKPVWTLLPFAPDWRWLLGRTDSPWYPTMRLFRQPKIGDWDTVIAEVCEQLRLLVQTRREAS